MSFHRLGGRSTLAGPGSLPHVDLDTKAVKQEKTPEDEIRFKAHSTQYNALGGEVVDTLVDHPVNGVVQPEVLLQHPQQPRVAGYGETAQQRTTRKHSKTGKSKLRTLYKRNNA